MMKVNTVLFMSVIEASVVFLGLAIFFYLRSKRTGKSQTSDQADMTSLISQLEEEAERLSREQPENEAEGKVNAARLNLVVSIIGTIKQGGQSDGTSLWDDVYGSLDNVVAESVTTAQSGSITQHEVTEMMERSAPETAVPSQDQASQPAVAMQKKQILELLRYKEMFNELNKEFTKLKEFNEHVMEAIEEPAVNSEPLQTLIMDLEKKNKHLDKLSGGLKKEGDYMNHRIEDYENLNLGTGGGGSPPKAARFETQGASDSGREAKLAARIKQLEQHETQLSNKVDELDKALKEKEEAYKNLQREYVSLEEEFIKLHKSHPGETGWSSNMQ
jgi:hypothetical protein